MKTSQMPLTDYYGQDYTLVMHASRYRDGNLRLVLYDLDAEEDPDPFAEITVDPGYKLQDRCAALNTEDCGFLIPFLNKFGLLEKYIGDYCHYSLRYPIYRFDELALEIYDSDIPPLKKEDPLDMDPTEASRHR
jgi:hypothetical protein